jgi:hypothetical protein
MWDRRPSQRNLLHVLPGALGTLADRIRHLPCPADADANTPIIIADDHQCPEAKPPATLDYLGRSGNVHDSLIQLVALFLAASSPSATILLSTAHRSSLSSSSRSCASSVQEA